VTRGAAKVIPFNALIGSFALFLLLGRFGVAYFQGWQHALRASLGLMFLLTASAHWGKRRPDLIAMIPPSISLAGLWVTLTGILEIAGAIGLQIPRLAMYAAGGLFVMLLAVFPANVYAAKHHLKIGGQPVPSLLPRILIQIVFLTALAFAACPSL
jgi:uncharacterized membrane protein